MKIKSLFESKFIKVFDLQYREGRHYYNATRRDEEDLVAAKSTEEFKKNASGCGELRGNMESVR